MSDAIRLYVGHVMHMRLAPRRHRFRYRVFTCLFDLDRMDAAMAESRVWGRILRFEARDHGPRDGTHLRPWVERLLAERGLPAPARIACAGSVKPSEYRSAPKEAAIFLPM